MILAGVVIAAKALPDDTFPKGMTAHVAPTLGLGAVLVLAFGAIRPGPIVLVTGIAVAEAFMWLWLFVVFLALGGSKEVLAGAPSDDTSA